MNISCILSNKYNKLTFHFFQKFAVDNNNIKYANHKEY